MSEPGDIIKKLGNLPERYIALIIVSASDYLKTNMDILKYLCNEKELYGIYITVNRPYESMVNIMERRGIDTDNIFFIDCISTILGDTPFREDRCLFTSPGNLTDLAVLIDQWVRDVPTEDKFLFLDSVSTLLIYNSVGTVAKFSHFLTGKMRQWGLSGILISLEKENKPKVLEDISQFCDKIITVPD